MNRIFQGCAARVVLVVPFAAFFLSPSAALASPILGTAVNFAVLGGSTVTSTGVTTVTGDLGVWPGTAFTNGGVFTQTGSQYFGPGPGVAETAEANVTTAYNYLADMAVTQVLTGQDLGGMTLDPGVYYFSSSAQLTGTLTLNAENNPNAIFVFQIGSQLTTSSNSAVDVINGGAGDGVYWQVGSSAVLGGGTAFLGNILAYSSVSLDTGATICGRALAENAEVSMIGNTVSDTCPAPSNLNNNLGDFGSVGFSGGNITPEPGTVPLLSVGLLALTFRGWRSRKRAA